MRLMLYKHNMTKIVTHTYNRVFFPRKILVIILLVGKFVSNLLFRKVKNFTNRFLRIVRFNNFNQKIGKFEPRMGGRGLLLNIMFY